MKHVFIINPTAGKADSRQKIYDMADALRTKHHLDVQCILTKKQGHATEIARRMCDSGEELRFYACGGDGTLNEVVNGVVGCPNAAVTHYPGGSGNDAIKIFDDPAAFTSIERLLSAEEAPFDLIRCNDSYALNVLSIGFDARVGTDIARFKRLPLVTGKGAYVLSILSNMVHGLSADYTVTLDSGEVLSGQKTMICICNGRWYGGSFNPLLLECLDALSDTIRREDTAREDSLSQEKPIFTEELYRNRDMAAARMTHQLEDARARQDFFTRMSREMWFEYTVQPSSLQLSLGAMQQTGLPAVMVDPLQNRDFLTLIGGETAETVRQQLTAMTPDEPYAEVSVKLLLNGQLRRCRLAMFLSWSAVEKNRFRSLFGKVINVEENYTRLEDHARAGIPQMKQQVLLPLTAADGVLRISGQELAPILQAYRQMFQIVRLVDPGICMQVIAADDGHTMEKVGRCYSIWDKTQRCRHCVSQEVVRTRRTLNKVEAIGSDLYYILAMCVEVDGFPYSLECVNPIYSDDLLSDENENLLNQLLMRNRQVYTDSLTKVFNRRYCDDRLRRLSGEYALAMIDIDNLKQINDRFGHPAGDTAIYHTAQAIRAILRSQDELVRYGGDEFLLLFHSLPQNILRRKLEDICRAVRALRVADLPELRITVSIGGVYAAGQISELVEKADLALYRAKAQKDSAVLYEEDFHDSE